MCLGMGMALGAGDEEDLGIEEQKSGLSSAGARGQERDRRIRPAHHGYTKRPGRQEECTFIAVQQYLYRDAVQSSMLFVVYDSYLCQLLALESYTPHVMLAASPPDLEDGAPPPPLHRPSCPLHSSRNHLHPLSYP